MTAHRPARPVETGESTSTNLARLKYNGRLCQKLVDYPIPDRVMLETTPLAPAANHVFSAEELTDRIAHYARRAAARLPLFTHQESAQ